MFYEVIQKIKMAPVFLKHGVYTYDLHHNFSRSLTVEKFNPQLISHNNQTLPQFISSII